MHPKLFIKAQSGCRFCWWTLPHPRPDGLPRQRREERSPPQREESACWAGAERRQPGLDPWSDPALVAVYEKASVLLRGHEFRLFDELVVRYMSRRLDVVRLVGSLLELLRSPEKVRLLLLPRPPATGSLYFNWGEGQGVGVWAL